MYFKMTGQRRSQLGPRVQHLVNIGVVNSYDDQSYPNAGAEYGGQAAPGWYPVDAYSQRYWDGYEWTANTAPLYPQAGRQLAVTSDDRTYALIMHLGGFFASVFVPLIMWLIKKNDSPFIDHHGRQSLNFHISYFIYTLVSFVLMLVLIGFFLLLAVVAGYFIFTIIAAVEANKGNYYKFPLVIPFLQ